MKKHCSGDFILVYQNHCKVENVVKFKDIIYYFAVFFIHYFIPVIFMRPKVNQN